MTLDEARKLKPGDRVREISREIKSVEAFDADGEFGEVVSIEYDDGGTAECDPELFELANEEPFYRLHDWLDEDRERRSVVIRASNVELWWVALSIDGNVINAKSGVDLEVTVAEVMEGMVIADAGQ